jgi:3-phenylpropionate/cinnamic acid dioxygenase small subunit
MAHRDRVMLAADIAEFFYQEADLLDERRFEEWLGVFTEDVQYFMPLARNMRHDEIGAEFTSDNEIAWFEEGLVTLQQRVKQLATGVHWIEEPLSRVSHLITNVRVLSDETCALGREVRTSARILVYQNRNETETVLLAGKRLDTVRETTDGWRVCRREVRLDQNVLMAKALTTFF